MNKSDRKESVSPVAHPNFYTNVFFRATFNTNIGERVCVVGSAPTLGNWDATKGHELKTSSDLFPSWFSLEPVLLRLKQKVEYKYVILSCDGRVLRWEEHTGNRYIVPTGVEMTVEDDNGRYREQAHLQIGSSYVPPSLESESLLPSAGSPQPGRPVIQGVVPPWGRQRSFRDDTAASSAQPSQQIASGVRQIDQLAQLEADCEIDENDTLWVLALDLPVKVQKRDDGTLRATPSKYALLPTLWTLRNKVKIPVKFIGWPGVYTDDEQEREKVAKLLEPHDCIPIFGNKKDFSEYLSFCHHFLWPLFHNIVVMDTQAQQPFNNAQWACYQKVNKLYAEVLVRNSHETDIIWIHDYHLLLLPQLISRRMRKANVGLFLHVPFPSSEIFRTLPVREELLRGMLCADLIGFHFFEYARHFLVACKRLLGLDHNFRIGGYVGVEYGGRNVMIRIGHVHIEYDNIRHQVETSARIEDIKADFVKNYPGRFIFASVDRCERLAGLLLKLRAFKLFLDSYPDAQNKVVLIQYAYPTVSYWDDTNKMRQEIVDLADKINSLYADAEEDANAHVPHVVLYVREVPREEKWALFKVADCLVDTSIRDGLNLNPFEYICCRKDNPGSVILSEFTGCSRALSSAMRVNPWRAEEVAEAMYKATTQHMDDSRDRFQRDQSYLQHGSTLKWAEEFLLDLRRARKREDMMFVSWGFGSGFRVLGMDQNFRRLDIDNVVHCFKASKNRVFFFDHEGTLAPDKRRIHAVPGDEQLMSKGSPPSEQVISCLQTLTKDPRNTVVILSGRDKDLLASWFAGVDNLGLCAEHGFYYKLPSIAGNNWYCVAQNIDFTWKQLALELMNQYVKRTQGSFIENKGSALVFQYRDADPDFGQWQAKELHNYLSEMLFGYPVTVMSGKGYVEVKLRGVNKGTAVQKVLKRVNTIIGDVDFILCIGDDRSDEDMFAIVNELCYLDECGNPVPPPLLDRASSVSPHSRHQQTLLQQDTTAGPGASHLNRIVESPAPGQVPQGGFADEAGGSGECMGSGSLLRRPDGVVDGSSRRIVSPQISRPIASRRRLSPGGRGSVHNASGTLSGSFSCSLMNRGRTGTGASDLLEEVAGEKVLDTGLSFFTVTVGKKPSRAKFYLSDTDEVSEMLEALQLVMKKQRGTIPHQQSQGPVDDAIPSPTTAAAISAVQATSHGASSSSLVGPPVRSPKPPGPGEQVGRASYPGVTDRGLHTSSSALAFVQPSSLFGGVSSAGASLDHDQLRFQQASASVGDISQLHSWING